MTSNWKEVMDLLPLLKENEMVEPFSVRITCSDSEGKEFLLFENKLLPYETLVAVQAAIAKAFVSLGEAAVELKKSKEKA